MLDRFTIVGLGEALFDIYADKHVLGGAPLNVALHAHRLAKLIGGAGVAVSRVGQDELGEELRRLLVERGMTTQYIQADPDKSTGKVYVTFDENGRAAYEIASDAAWDWLQYDPDADSLAQRCQAVCFGTLAQRNAQTRNTIYRFLETARNAIRLFDVNLRDADLNYRLLQKSCQYATVVKMNQEELPVVCGQLGLFFSEAGAGEREVMGLRARGLLKKFKLKLVVVTRGEEGTILFTADGEHQGQPVRYPAAADFDSVGAGDACAAGVLVGLLLRWPLGRVVELADHLGAFVASQPGATPELPEGILAMLRA